MKTILSTTLAATLLASTAQAGGFATEIVEVPPEIVVPQDAPGSLPAWVVPAAIAVVLIAIATQGGSDEDDDDP